MSRQSRSRRSSIKNASTNQIISLFDSEIEQPSEEPVRKREQTKSFHPTGSLKGNRKKRFLYPALGVLLAAFLVIGVMGKNGWLPSTDALSGKRTGWFGTEVKAGGDAATSGSNAYSAANPSAAAAMTTTSSVQLSKEYIYAGSRMLAVEDANANAAPPADLAVWRKSTGTWYVLNSSNQQWTVQQWGNGTDQAAPADYDGDGKTDFSIFRPSEGNWYVIGSSNGAMSSSHLGISTDTVAPADYDGDGRTDLAVYRDGTWYVVRSSDQTVTYTQFGLSTDTPTPKDFDGDGKADFTVWRASAGMFYTLRSSDGALQTQGGAQASDVPVSADYDGDGRTDYAVRRGNDWIYIQSSDGALQVITWQQASDQAVENDYDGDGKVDIAVWRESTGMWYIRQSSKIGQANELRQVQWGTTGDTPVPAFYRR